MHFPAPQLEARPKLRFNSGSAKPPEDPLSPAQRPWSADLRVDRRSASISSITAPRQAVPSTAKSSTDPKAHTARSLESPLLERSPTGSPLSGHFTPEDSLPQSPCPKGPTPGTPTGDDTAPRSLSPHVLVWESAPATPRKPTRPAPKRTPKRPLATRPPPTPPHSAWIAHVVQVGAALRNAEHILLRNGHDARFAALRTAVEGLAFARPEAAVGMIEDAYKPLLLQGEEADRRKREDRRARRATRKSAGGRRSLIVVLKYRR